MSARFLKKRLAYLALGTAAFALAPYLIPLRGRAVLSCRELARADDQFVALEGFAMRYRVLGPPDALPIILIHGFASSLVTWYRNLHVLARDYRVYALDLKGWGLSDKPRQGEYSMAAQAQHVRAFMRALGIERAVIVGHSMGGAIAVHLAAAHPESVLGVVLIDPAGARPFPYLWWVCRLMDVPPLRQWARVGAHYALSSERLLTRNMPRAYHDPSQLSDELKQALLLPFQTHGFIDALINLTRDTRSSHLNGRARDVRCPALIVWGAQDRVVPASDGQYFLRELRDARLVLIDNAGHLPHEEQADKVNQLIQEFVAQLDAPRAA